MSVDQVSAHRLYLNGSVVENINLSITVDEVNDAKNPTSDATLKLSAKGDLPRLRVHASKMLSR